MKNIIHFFSTLNDWGNTKEAYKTDLQRLINRLLTLVFIFTVILWLIIFWISHNGNAIAHLTFLAVAVACFSGGIAFGFLFGIPRAVKIRVNTGKPGETTKDSLYDDNTNLEEISDWLTKIIVGLTLIKFNTILGWIKQCAIAAGATLSHKPPCQPECTDYYVFSYAIIVLYFTLGLGASYLWTRTYFKLILIQNRKEQERLEKEEIIRKQAIANKEIAENAIVGTTGNQKRMIEQTEGDFMNMVKEKYKNTSVLDKSDLQKGRWGGLSEVDGWKLSASVDADRSFMDLYKLVLTVKNVADGYAPATTVAFFLHDTFPREIVFVQAENGVANLELTSYEAFTAGAMLPNGTTLELDLNEVPGFPKNFYWTDQTP